jgi:hypothetical protein
MIGAEQVMHGELLILAGIHAVLVSFEFLDKKGYQPLFRPD